ncbi:homoserine O-acetyltransferase [Paraneptunicella aestuarii]|uniref:E22 family MetX-like putative esterase n=1 Tax=Paraneptunicella aestuarii TaxID=2831148 RepID=UPI001E5E6E3B|nr:homoserine O-acetyltransferase [Paraneptunicella aestuarii]UAA38355.1 homoserine O-acetyltransferase [Paraneptunicella aestuarii]
MKKLVCAWLFVLSGYVFADQANQINTDVGLVEKKSFTISNFQTFNGKMIKDVKVGWESYGSLNQDKSNAILITHYFSGNSHAAGKYHQDDAKAGYWDAIIGPGKAIDTNLYYVLSVDTLVNAGVHDPNVITTGPASINPDTGKPYGLSFPVVTIRDFVNVQKALLDSLGIGKLHAVVGASMGSLQAIDWASAYPDRVPRMVSVIGMGQSDAWTALALHQWAVPITLDPKWNKGNYYDGDAPLDGLAGSLMVITQQALHPKFINQVNAQHSPLEEAPMMDILANHKAVDWLQGVARNRAEIMDANHVLYLIRACQLFVTGHDGDMKNGLSKIKAKSLFLPSSGDLLLMPYMAKEAHDELRALNKASEYAELQGTQGHLDGVYSIQQKAEKLRAFLAD